MGGGASSVKETSAEKEAAAVAKEQWDLYKSELSPYEDMFMNKVDKLNSEQAYDKSAADTNLGYQQAFTEARGNTANSLASAGVDPTSGKYQAAMDDITTRQATGQIDTTNRAQTDQANKYIAGLQDVVSIGQGQKAEALQGLGSQANAAQRQALTDASNAQASAGAIGDAVGTGIGMAGSHYMNMNKKKKTPTETPAWDSSALKQINFG